MAETAPAAMHTAVNAVHALGKGFDANFDTRLLYCKGTAGTTRLVEIDEVRTYDLFLCDDIVVSNVSRDIRKSEEPSDRHSSGIRSYYEMIEYFNHKANLSGYGDFPLGNFNAVFGFTGSKHIDAAAAKALSVDGFHIPLAKFQLVKFPLVLQEHVKRAVPVSWDPPALASFIENFGTHVITSVTIGGKDAVYIKQLQSSPLSDLQIKNYAQEIGDQRFSEKESYSTSGQTKLKDKVLDSVLFNNQGIYPQPMSTTYLTGKEDVTVIFRRRGGDDLEQDHKQWARTIKSSPDVIDMTFFPIAALLDGIAGKEHLTRAISLYLEYKPPIEELRFFLEFQIPRVWAPIQDNVPGQQRKEPVCPSLQFSVMGQKLYVSHEQVPVGRRPVTGMQLCLEGTKENRLCVRVEHLVSLPKILHPHWDTHVAIGAPKWVGPEEQDSRWFEPIKWKKFSHVCTAPIESPRTLIGDSSGVYIVTGAQLGVWDFGSRNVLYMKLLYSRVPGCTIRRSKWDHAPNDKSKGLEEKKGGNKLGKLIDVSEMKTGPQDSPGHWLVTGGKLGIERAKMVLRLHYSLLNY